jgi:T5SS/PEP-CTERM-associated repeat protein
MGADSEWKNAGDLTVENGNLRIRGGGSVVNIDGYVAKESGSYGIVTVDGNGSVWTNSSELFMNGDGVGILYVQNEAVVYVAETMYLGTGYTYHLETGGELQTGSIVTAASVARGVAASGSVSGMDQGGIISLHPGGAIQFSGGRIRADMLDLTGGGEFNWTGGLLEVARVEGSLVNQGGVLYPLRIPPEGILVRGDYFQEAAGRLLLAIRGNNTDQVDLLHVTGDAMIDGQVVMMFINGFAPRMGDQFPLVMADGLLSDEEAIYRVQNLAPGFRFDIVRDGGVVTMVALNDGVFVPEPSALLYPLISFAIPTMLRFRPKARRQFAV